MTTDTMTSFLLEGVPDGGLDSAGRPNPLMFADRTRM